MLREITHIVSISNRDHSIEETSTINESQERVAPAPESQSEKNQMACAKRSENQHHQPLGQVRGDREEHSNAIDLDQSELTVIRELSKGHESGNNGMKTRATTARETA